MLSTVEVRWFFEGAIDQSIWDWFHGSSSRPIHQPSRVDYYLAGIKLDNLGVKLREGKLEIKLRRKQFGVKQFANWVAGFIEGWIKWSFPLSESPGLPVDLSDPTTYWVTVEKERRLFMFRLVSAGLIENATEAGTLDQGCNLELTEVLIRKKRWWTLGFEAYGEEDRLLELITKVAKSKFADTKGNFSLEPRNSSSYPRWLCQLEEKSSS